MSILRVCWVLLAVNTSSAWSSIEIPTSYAAVASAQNGITGHDVDASASRSGDRTILMWGNWNPIKTSHHFVHVGGWF